MQLNVQEVKKLNTISIGDFNLWMEDVLPPMVIYHSGNLPLIFTVSHGGSSTINNLPKRIEYPHVKDFATPTDAHTIELTLAMMLSIQDKIGEKPYSIINLLDRAYLDVNRAPEDAYQHPQAQSVYQEYHRQIRTAIRSVKSQFGNGLLIDIHGQSAELGDLYFGDRNGLTIQSLTKQYGTDILKNEHGLVHQLTQKKYDTYPRPGYPTPASVFGGYTIRTYGSHNSDGIDAEQIEIHYRIRSDANKRKKFIDDFSECLIAFIEEYYLVNV